MQLSNDKELIVFKKERNKDRQTNARKIYSKKKGKRRKKKRKKET
uniref:Uncharacterized protein n=1 Tax=Rhizophora mucronata TaxID=61149 RepID=A0A2P2J3N4_RHIMU